MFFSVIQKVLIAASHTMRYGRQVIKLNGTLLPYSSFGMVKYTFHKGMGQIAYVETARLDERRRICLNEIFAL